MVCNCKAIQIRRCRKPTKSYCSLCIYLDQFTRCYARSRQNLESVLILVSFLIWIIAISIEKDWSGSVKALIFAITVLGLSYGLALTVMAVRYWKIFRIARSHVRRINVQRFNSRKNCGTLQMVDGFSGSLPTFVEESAETTFGKTSSIRQAFQQTQRHPHFSDIHIAKSFLVVIGAYFLCWTPFCITLFLDIVMKGKVNSKVSLICLWLGYSNSRLNPLIYTWKYRQFRNALVSTAKKFHARYRFSLC